MGSVTDEERGKLETAFGYFDENGSGYLEDEELSAALGEAGIEPTARNIAMYIQNVKTGEDEEERVDLGEFLHLYEVLKAETDGDRVRLETYFAEEADVDRNGTLDAGELKHLLEEHEGGDWDNERVDEFMEMADKDENGVIDVKELLDALFPFEHPWLAADEWLADEADGDDDEC